jgi:hypothetical protein
MESPSAIATATGEPISEIDVLWITAGLGCDGDTVAMTAATQPSIEDIVTHALPWTPKVNFLNPFLSLENGSEFMHKFHLAAEGRLLRPFILVVEGSIPDESNKTHGYWAAFGTDSSTGQPITTCEWIDRLTAQAWAVVAVGPALLMAAFTPCREIPPDVWACLTIWAGNGDRTPAYQSFVSQDAPCSRTTSLRHCCISYTWLAGELRSYLWMMPSGLHGCLAIPCMKAAIAAVFTNRPNLRMSMVRRCAS